MSTQDYACLVASDSFAEVITPRNIQQIQLEGRTTLHDLESQSKSLNVCSFANSKTCLIHAGSTRSTGLPAWWPRESAVSLLAMAATKARHRAWFAYSILQTKKCNEAAGLSGGFVTMTCESQRVWPNQQGKQPDDASRHG